MNRELAHKLLSDRRTAPGELSRRSSRRKTAGQVGGHRPKKKWERAAHEHRILFIDAQPHLFFYLAMVQPHARGNDRSGSAISKEEAAASVASFIVINILYINQGPACFGGHPDEKSQWGRIPMLRTQNPKSENSENLRSSFAFQNLEPRTQNPKMKPCLFIVSKSY